MNKNFKVLIHIWSSVSWWSSPEGRELREVIRQPEHVTRAATFGSGPCFASRSCGFLTAGVWLFLLVILPNWCGGWEGLPLACSCSSFQTGLSRGRQAGQTKWPGVCFPGDTTKEICLMKHWAHFSVACTSLTLARMLVLGNMVLLFFNNEKILIARQPCVLSRFGFLRVQSTFYVALTRIQ